MTRTRCNAVAKRGVTLMECIFAIGVILTGLVGLAALIPVASQNARDTMEIDRSISESTSAAAVGLVQSFHDLDTLVIADKPVQGSPAASFGVYRFLPTNALQTVESKLTSGSQKLESPGYMHQFDGDGLSSGICIDPFGTPDIALMNSASSYVNAPNTSFPFYAPAATDSAFDYSRFPYFNERYNVLSPPNLSVGTPGNPVGPPATKPWPMSPRMWRATLKSPIYPSTNPIDRWQLLSSTAVRRMFQGTSGLSPAMGNAEGEPRSVLSEPTVIGGRSVDASRDGSSEYTWFATITPPFGGGDSYRQSIIVVRKRLPPVPRRVDDPFALQRTNYTIDDSDDNPSAERLTWINPIETIGFSGGAGGEVTIYGSQAISDKVATGNWVLLSRQPHIDIDPTAGVTWRANGPAVHRWFRILSVSEPTLTANYAWPGGTHDVWSRRLSLAGPDWSFQDEDTNASTNTTPIDDTFCTIIEGAVSVIESEVRFE